MRHETVDAYDAASQPIVDYAAPIEMSADARKIAIVIEELASGAWGGAVVEIAPD